MSVVPRHSFHINTWFQYCVSGDVGEMSGAHCVSMVSWWTQIFLEVSRFCHNLAWSGSLGEIVTFLQRFPFLFQKHDMVKISPAFVLCVQDLGDLFAHCLQRLCHSYSFCTANHKCEVLASKPGTLCMAFCWFLICCKVMLRNCTYKRIGFCFWHINILLSLINAAIRSGCWMLK